MDSSTTAILPTRSTPQPPPSRPPRRVIGGGAGLGGCATALAMHHAGFAVRVFDRVRHFQRLGDSLGLGENALLLLDR